MSVVQRRQVLALFSTHGGDIELMGFDARAEQNMFVARHAGITKVECPLDLVAEKLVWQDVGLVMRPLPRGRHHHGHGFPADIAAGMCLLVLAMEIGDVWHGDWQSVS